MKIQLKVDFFGHKKGEIIDAIDCGKDWLVGCNTAKLQLPGGSFTSHLAQGYDYEVVNQQPAVQDKQA